MHIAVRTASLTVQDLFCNGAVFCMANLEFCLRPWLLLCFVSFVLARMCLQHAHFHFALTPHPHMAYSSYNPVSRQDSELQSLSSEARTESDNMSLKDSSV